MIPTTIRERAFQMMLDAGIPLRAEEQRSIEIADFGLGRFLVEGASIATLIATERYAVKSLALFPGQALPEHWHPAVGDDPGKQETIRVVKGTCLLFTEGRSEIRHGVIPEGKESVYTCRNEQVLASGDQRTLAPGAKHWFQGGPEGCVVFSFSSTVRDLKDGFTDPAIVRKP